jgi:diadenosine tetraphosphate (Ap4A) HIT family hydrolase
LLLRFQPPNLQKSQTMKTLIHERVEQAQARRNPTVICRMPSGWAVLGDAQFLRGYCLLLPDPVVPDLNALDADARRQYLYDATIIGDALLEVTDADRINYEILGNLDPALHTHIFPRYRQEPESYQKGPIYYYPREQRASRPFDRERDRKLIQQLAEAIRSKL